MTAGDGDDADGGGTDADGGGDSARHTALFSLTCPDDDRADRVRAAVTGEVGEIDDERSRAALDGADRTVTVDVEARDVSALRAATGTWLGLLEAANRTAAVAEAADDRDERPE